MRRVEVLGYKWYIRDMSGIESALFLTVGGLKNAACCGFFELFRGCFMALSTFME
jgi:hypothetical protein